MKAHWSAERRIDEMVREPYYYDDLETLAREAIALLRRVYPIVAEVRYSYNATELVADTLRFLDGEGEK